MLKKILIVAGVLLVLIVGAAVLLPIIYKDKIVALVKEEVNKNINAKVDFGDFDLTILSSFPDFTIKIDQLSVIGIAPNVSHIAEGGDYEALTLKIKQMLN